MFYETAKNCEHYWISSRQYQMPRRQPAQKPSLSMTIRPNQLFVIVIGSVLFSCGERESNETRHLFAFILSSIPSYESERIVISEDSFSDWKSLGGFSECSLEEFERAQKQSMRVVSNEVEVGDILSAEDVAKICSQRMLAYRFPKELFPPNVILESQLALDASHSRYQEDLFDENGEVNLKVEKEGFQEYYRFSKPVFLQSYRYAFVFYSKVGRLSGFSNLLILEKKEGGWEYSVGIVLNRYG